jgi:hypothetical protein
LGWSTQTHVETDYPMAKRARGTKTRPGQRAPLQRRGPVMPRLSSPVEPTIGGLTDAEEARAAELEAAIVATERTAARAATTSAPSERPAVRAVEPRVRTGTGSIAARAADEYGYVSRDVRRIALVGGSLLILLLAFWAVVQATGMRLY